MSEAKAHTPGGARLLSMSRPAPMTCFSRLHPLFYQNLPIPEPAETPCSAESLWPWEALSPRPCPPGSCRGLSCISSAWSWASWS